MFFPIHFSYFACALLGLFLALGICVNIKDLSGLFSKVAGRHWLLLLALFAAAIVLRMFVVPHRPYVFYDEYEHIHVAKSLLEEGLFSRCDFYIDGKCLSSYLPHWVPGYDFLLSLVFAVTGVGESAAHVFNAAASSATVVVLFLAVFLWVGRAGVALTASALLAFLPLHLKFAGCASPETVSLLTVLLSLLAFSAFLKLKTRRSFFLVMAAIAFAMMIRAENALLAVLCLGVFWPGIGPKRFLGLFPFGLLIVLPLTYLPYIRTFMLEHYLATTSHAFGWRLFLGNLSYWMQDHSVPVIVVALALLAAGSSWTKKRFGKLWMPAYFMVYLFVYTFNRMNLNGGGTQRFNLLLCFPVIVLASIALDDIRRSIGGPRVFKGFVLAGLILALTAGYLKGFSYVRSEISDPVFREEHRLFQEGREAAEGCVYVAYNPSSVVSTLGRSCVHISYLFDSGIYDSYLRGRCLVLVDDYWCRRNGQDRCRAVKERFVLERIGSGRLFFSLREK